MDKLSKEKFAPIVRGKEVAAHNGDKKEETAISSNVIRFLQRIKNIVEHHLDDHSHAGQVWVNGAFYCTEEQWVHALRVNPL